MPLVHKILTTNQPLWKLDNSFGHDVLCLMKRIIIQSLFVLTCSLILGCGGVEVPDQSNESPTTEPDKGEEPPDEEK